ncbi:MULTISPECIES: NCS1 family nucleobase:cation symporter-1 [unclassified Frondihabitans]|uniref:NCS1 family nucleobase:cation symporter-1 n=1 Tax=unclassified Frondihabitans TaxID=2626248 RepID=UPI000F510148|nr:MULTISPECIES: NCS1 family nucleobase:cation symporter-1 [unclassified Frondihabitans]RPE78056.1 NCS1 family nucleobase:cation symporter-1 [Frondihabitans sp. PhB153]RPF08336.1 NCS1 family nucleobase:cation symporter-1 [Frondihabitans sp. PhB161]
MATNVVPPSTSADPREQANAQASQQTGAQAGQQPGAQPPLTGPHDVVEAAGHPAGSGLVKPEYDPRLTNEDLAPLRKQTWGGYNFFAFWMSDVHSVGGYVTAGSLFALGIASWQVLISLVVGILIVMVFTNLVAKPSQKTGVPFPVINRAVFGVLGANIPAIIRGLIAMAWYGVQTFLAAQSLNIIFLKFIPSSAALLDHSFLGLNALGWISYAILWVAQAALFWRGMETIRKFIDFAGPAVYVIMIALAIYLVAKAGWGNISLNLSVGEPLSLSAAIPVMISAVAIVVSYFSGPMLNFGDFSRYGKSFTAVKRGNFLGLPVNFLFFSILTVLCASATVPVFGRLITDPIETVQAIGAPFAILLGGLTFVTATVGINIVANFISPAFDFSNVAPRKISWRMGGMIAAVGSVLLTPWNWYGNPQAIQYTLGVLGALIGPLFGLLIAGYYLVGKQRVAVDDLFSMEPTGRYWFKRGFNPNAVWTMVIAGGISVAAALVPTIVKDLGGPDFTWLGNYGWFIGCALGLALFWLFETLSPRMPELSATDETVNDGTLEEAH